MKKSELNKIIREEIINEKKKQSKKQLEYQKFFKEMLKKYDIKSPAELDDGKKKEFFNAIEKGWTKDVKENVIKESGYKIGNMTIESINDETTISVGNREIVFDNDMIDEIIKILKKIK
jgi:hypothetical protein